MSDYQKYILLLETLADLTGVKDMSEGVSDLKNKILELAAAQKSGDEAAREAAFGKNVEGNASGSLMAALGGVSTAQAAVTVETVKVTEATVKSELSSRELVHTLRGLGDIAEGRAAMGLRSLSNALGGSYKGLIALSGVAAGFTAGVGIGKAIDEMVGLSDAIAEAATKSSGLTEDLDALDQASFEHLRAELDKIKQIDLKEVVKDLDAGAAAAQKMATSTGAIVDAERALANSIIDRRAANGEISEDQARILKANVAASSEQEKIEAERTANRTETEQNIRKRDDARNQERSLHQQARDAAKAADAAAKDAGIAATPAAVTQARTQNKANYEDAVANANKYELFKQYGPMQEGENWDDYKRRVLSPGFHARENEINRVGGAVTERNRLGKEAGDASKVRESVEAETTPRMQSANERMRILNMRDQAASEQQATVKLEVERAAREKKAAEDKVLAEKQAEKDREQAAQDQEWNNQKIERYAVQTPRRDNAGQVVRNADGEVQYNTRFMTAPAGTYKAGDTNAAGDRIGGITIETDPMTVNRMARERARSEAGDVSAARAAGAPPEKIAKESKEADAAGALAAGIGKATPEVLGQIIRYLQSSKGTMDSLLGLFEDSHENMQGLLGRIRALELREKNNRS